MVRDSDGYVENICNWCGPHENLCEWCSNHGVWTPPAGVTMILAPEDVGVGWTFNGEWGPPEIPPDPLLSA